MTLKKIKTTFYDIEADERIADFKGTKFVMISDFHNNDYKVDSAKILRSIKDINPYGIIVAGDIITAIPGEDNKEAFRFLSELKKIAKVYMANGNHEYRTRIYKDIYGDVYDEFLKCVEANDIILLNNESIELNKGESKIRITGLEIDKSYYARLKRVKMEDSYVEKVLGKVKKDAYNILIAHNPKYFKQYANWGADLVLSGHCHGGIVRLPKRGGLIAPDFTIFPRYSYGLYQRENSRLIVSSGLGTHTFKIRIFNPCEIVCFSVQ